MKREKLKKFCLYRFLLRLLWCKLSIGRIISSKYILHTQVKTNLKLWNNEKVDYMNDSLVFESFLETFPWRLSLRLIVYLRGSVTVDIFYRSINNDFLQHEIQNSADEEVANGDN